MKKLTYCENYENVTEMKLSTCVGKMTLINLLDAGWPQTFNSLLVQ